MNEFAKIINEYNSLVETSTKLALATVIDVKGSSYRRTGARMLIQDNGVYHGGISGGCIEGNALKKAHLAMSKNKALEVTYDTSKDDEAEIGISLGCNGVISVLIAPIDINDDNNPVEQLRLCIDNRQASVLLTVIEADPKLDIVAGQSFKYSSETGLKDFFRDSYQSEIENDVKDLLMSGKSNIKTYNNYKLFLEVIPPTIKIIMMGGNYDVYPLLKIANSLGWHSVVVANPKRLATNIHGLANQVVTDFSDVIIDEFTVGVLMSHDYNADLRNLQKALASNLQYIGLLGPATRKAEMLEDLPAGFERSNKERIFGPAGLDIGAAQPEEIAISIVSEILAVMRNRSGSSLRERQGPIHKR